MHGRRGRHASPNNCSVRSADSFSATATLINWFSAIPSSLLDEARLVEQGREQAQGDVAATHWSSKKRENGVERLTSQGATGAYARLEFLDNR